MTDPDNPRSDTAEAPTVPAGSEVPPSAAPSGFRPGGNVRGYRIERLLGQGGMGLVYEARHAGLDKRVAIKTLLPELACKPDVRARFVREGQAASKVRHDHVVDMYDVGEQDGTPFLVMEFLEGESLRDLLTRKGRLSVGEACDVMIPVLVALAAAHDQGVVHRDLKPENVFMCKGRAGAVHPKIVDFGISKVVTDEQSQGLTGTAALLGTPYYMSPEQAQSAKHIDARTDQYSAAVMLYEAVVGRKPFEDASLFALMRAIVDGRFEPPRKLVPELPEPFAEAVVRAMSAQPADRFPCTRDLAAALLPFAGDRTRALHAEEIVAPARDQEPFTDPSAAGSSSGTLGGASESFSGTSKKRGSRRARIAAAAGLAAAAITVAAFVALRSHDSAPTERASETAPSQAPSTVASAPATASIAAPSASIASPAAASAHPLVRTVRSKPLGAAVYVRGEKVGTTPYEVSVPLDGGAVDIEVRAAGHGPAKVSVDGRETGDVVVELRKVAAGGAATPGGVPGLAPR
jgi:serine/threonine-protein kinase